MPLSWNFDPVIRNWLIIGLVMFYFWDWHLLAIWIATQIWWSEFDEDRAGFDLEEYIEHHLDEFGHYDTWAGDVYKAAEKYGDVAENYARTHQTRHTLFRRLYKVKDDEVIKDFDYAYWEDNYAKIEKDITDSLRQGLEKEKIMYEEYKQEQTVEEERTERARRVYEQFLSARVGENIKAFSASREEEGDIDATDIDDSGAELQYIYLLSEKMFEWIHSTAYEEKDSSPIDIEELWNQHVLSDLDKKTWKLNYKNTYNMVRSPRSSHNMGAFPIQINYQTELKVQPYPIFASWLDDPYSIIIKREKNKIDYKIISQLFLSSQPHRMDLINQTQENVKLSEMLRQQRIEKIRAVTLERKKAWDRAVDAYNDSIKKTIQNDKGNVVKCSISTIDKKEISTTKSVKKKIFYKKKK